MVSNQTISYIPQHCSILINATTNAFDKLTFIELYVNRFKIKIHTQVEVKNEINPNYINNNLLCFDKHACTVVWNIKFVLLYSKRCIIIETTSQKLYRLIHHLTGNWI